MALDTARFLTQVKMKAALPTGRFTDSEILEIAYDVLLTDVQPMIINIREEYYVKKTNVTVSDGYNTYPINTRALGLTLRELKYIDSASQINNLVRLAPEDINDSQSGKPYAFYLEGVNVILYPTPNESGTLVQSYFQRVSKPVETSSCAAITAIDTATGIVTATPPSTWTTSNSFDLISRNNGNDTLAKDLTATAVGGSSITFTASNLPSSLAVGDYIALAGESPYIQVPDELISYVTLLTCVDLFESLGDQTAVQMAMAKAEKLKEGLARTLIQRVQGESIRMKPMI